MARAKKEKETVKTTVLFPMVGNGIAWAKSLNVSNGRMEACSFGDIQDTFDVSCRNQVTVHTVEGRTSRKDQKSVSSTDQPNITLYKAEEASLPENADALYISFTVSLVNKINDVHSINLEQYKKMTDFAVFKRINDTLPVVLHEVAKNIMSGIWAWRNKENASSTKIWVKDGYGRIFDNAKDLAEAMIDMMARLVPFVFTVHGVFKMDNDNQHGASFVFPSQIMSTTIKEKRYFKINGQPALRGVKIANKLKEMDRWYRSYGDTKIVDSINPMGYSIRFSDFLRKPDESLIFFVNKILTSKALADEVMSNDDDMKFIAANLFFGTLITEGKSKASPEKDEHADEHADEHTNEDTE